MSKKSNHIFITSLEDIAPSFGLLPANEFDSAEKHGTPRRRRQFLAGRTLLRLGLNFVSGKPATGFKLELREGKPFLADDGKPLLSLSHSSAWIGCLISQSSLCGFDLQIRTERPVGEIADLFFHPLDRQWMQDQTEFDLAFYDLWTLKEAWAKAMGMDLMSAMGHQPFSPASRAPAEHGISAYTSRLDDPITMAWVVGDSGSHEVWRWNGQAFEPVRLVVKPWTPGNLFVTDNSENTRLFRPIRATLAH